MRENDIIAEYVKEKYPELLITPEFTFYKLGCALKNAVKAAKEWEATEEVMQDTWKQQTMSRFERVE